MLSRVRLQETWGPKPPLMDLTLWPKLIIEFSNMGEGGEEYFIYLGPTKFVMKWCHISLTSFLHTLDLHHSVNSLSPKVCSCPIRSLDFEVLWSWTHPNSNIDVWLMLHFWYPRVVHSRSIHAMSTIESIEIGTYHFTWVPSPKTPSITRMSTRQYLLEVKLGTCVESWVEPQ